MQDTILMHQSLTDVDDSVLIVIDVQQSFLDKMPKEQTRPIVNRISWMVQMAVKLNVPIVATAEDIPEEGTSYPKAVELGRYCFDKNRKEITMKEW